MLDKIKTLMHIKEEIDQINSKVDNQTGSLATLNEQIIAMKNLIEQFKTQQEEIVHEQKKVISTFQKDNTTLQDHLQRLEKEVYNFKMLKSKVQEDIMKKFDEELQQQLMEHSEKLQKETDHYESIKSHIESTANRLSSLHEQVAKLQEVAGTLQKEDFALTKTITQVQDLERQKQALQERLDKAERFAASKIRKHR